MKDLEEFKYQHQFDETHDFRKPRSKFGLISGMLLGTLAVGVLWPAGVKWVAKEKSAAHAMPAKKLRVGNEVTRPIDISRSPSHDKNSFVEGEGEGEGEEEVEAAPKVLPLLPTKKVAIEVAATKYKANDAIKSPALGTIKKSFKAHEIDKKSPIKLAKLEVPAKAPAPSQAFDSLEESEHVLSADDVQAKTNAVLLKSDLASEEGSDSVAFVTIQNAQYEKSTLSTCKAYCLLKAKDANGNAIDAVISGPNFADILSEHSGTINITGKKTNLKNHEVFMVQSITFNLPSQKATAQSSKIPPAAPAEIKKDRSSNHPYKGGTEAYEDLSSDPVPLR